MRSLVRENQQVLSRIHVLTDALIIYLMIPLSFWIRFSVFHGIVNVTLREFLVMGIFYTIAQILIFYLFGLYRAFRHPRLRRELPLVTVGCLVGLLLILSWMSLIHQDNYSRQMMLIFFMLTVGALGIKRIIMRRMLWILRGKGYNVKNVVIIGSGNMAKRYLNKVESEPHMGFNPLGYIAEEEGDMDAQWLGVYEWTEEILEKLKPDEVILASEPRDYDRTPEIIDACEKTGCKLSIIPLYEEYMSMNPQFDNFDGILLMNVRRIPLDNLLNAFLKRTFDILFSTLVLILFSPLMLVTAIGVWYSSPGPIIFKQERIGRNKKSFTMYKFRSMRVNSKQNTGWSSKHDSRKTRFGSFIRKYSIDELPQFWNVLKGDMSVVGPRPEVPYYVEYFKEKVPRYMLKHLVRPGITGWAQIHGMRGDTSILRRIRYDIYYIENWSPGMDLNIIFRTVFGKKFINDEELN